MKKIYLTITLVLMLVGLLAFADDDPAKEKELSYKTAKEGPRYLKQFKKIDYQLPTDNSATINNAEALKDTLLSLLGQAAENAMQLPWFMKIENEHVFLFITDRGNARYTLKVDKGKFEVVEGFDTTKVPTMVVPLRIANVENLAEIFSDGTLTYEEMYRIFYFITIPGLQAIYHNDVFFKPGDKTAFKFDDFLHIVIPPEEVVLYNGYPISIEVTVVNVDGQWLVFKGLQGDPDMTISLTLDEAAKLYQLAFYEVRKLKTPKQAKELSDKFLDYLASVVTYTRADHR